MKKNYKKIEAKFLTVETPAIMTGSTIGVSSNPVTPDTGGHLPAGARGVAEGTSSLGFDIDL